jgi:hypothetical protein
VSAGGHWGFSVTLQASLTSRSITNFPTDLKKPHTCTYLKLVPGEVCHTGSFSVFGSLLFSPPWSLLWTWLKEEVMGEIEKVADS